MNTKSYFRSLPVKTIAAVLAALVIVCALHAPNSTKRPVTDLATKIWNTLYQGQSISRSDVVISTHPSLVDPGWVYFTAQGKDSHVMFQYNYGFVYESKGTARIVASGSGQVGCSYPGVAPEHVAPLAVEHEFGYHCA